MVRPGNKPYRKASQKGPRGGKTRREQVRDKIQQRRRYLRGNDLEEITVSPKVAKKARFDTGDVPVYGIFRDEDASGDERWVLTAMTVKKTREKMTHHRGARGYSTTEVVGRWIIQPAHADPRSGIEIERAGTKSELVAEASKRVGRDGSKKDDYEGRPASERVENGAYIVYGDMDPAAKRNVRVDAGDWRAFKRTAIRVYEQMGD